MFPAQRGLFHHRSTMDQFARPRYQYLNLEPYPFTNAELTGLSPEISSPLLPQYSPGDDFYDQDFLNKECDSAGNLNAKKPLSKAERRAEHNAIERARRESLNTKFQSLANALPNLFNYRRPSKSQIVEKALEWVRHSLSREERYRYQILQLQRENKKLIAEVLMNQQHQQQNNVPTPRQSVSTPTPTSNTSSINAAMNLNLSSINNNVHTLDNSVNLPMNMDTNMYCNTEFIDANGWSNNSSIITTDTPQMTSFISTEDMNQDYEDDDNNSSSNEDDTEYSLSTCGPTSTIGMEPNLFLQKHYEQQQHQHRQPQYMVSPEFIPLNDQGMIETAISENCNNFKYPSKISNDSSTSASKAL